MQRYKVRCHDCDPEIIPHEAGKWVRWGDVERLRAELAAWRSALAKVGPYYIPATNVSDEEAEEVYAAIDAARKGEGE